jgi:aspartyl protease family protein
MIFLIGFVIVALAAGLWATIFGVYDLDAIAGLPAAGTVIAILAALYLATVLSHRGERRRALWPMLTACLASAIMLGSAQFKDAPLALAEFLARASVSRDATSIAPRNQSASVLIRRRDDGGFIANAEFNHASLEARVDSGATSVVLRYSDAEKAGVDVSALNYDTALRTANGTSYLAPVRIKSVKNGALALDDVEGLVAKPGTLNENLLGTSFLRRLSSYEVAGNFATLRQ